MDGNTKRCPRCKETKPCAEFNKDASALDGLNSECKECHRARASEYKRRRKGEKDAGFLAELSVKYGEGNTDTQRCCPDCGWQLKANFAGDPDKMKILRLCRVCSNIRRRAGHQRMMTTEKRVDYNLKQREKWAARTDHEREHDFERYRLYRTKNSSRIYARQSRWAKAHPEKKAIRFEKGDGQTLHSAAMDGFVRPLRKSLSTLRGNK